VAKPSWRTNSKVNPMVFCKGHRPFLLIVLAILAVTMLDGCWRGDGRRPLSGVVTLDGQPLEDATISFQPVPGNPGSTSGAATSNDGTFSISTDKGLKPGKYTVTVQKWKGTGRTFKDPKTGESVEITAPISLKEAGHLDVTVVDNGVNHFDFRLTSAK
jgi:hypothetical protein